MKTVAVILIFFAISSSVWSQTPHYKLISLPKDASGKTDFSQLEILRHDLREAEIVLLGEPRHVPKYYDIKVQLVKWLHENMDFDVLAFESGLFQMERANTVIKQGDDVQAAFENSVFPIWTQQDEFRKVYDYVDVQRQGNDPLEITGFDCQVSAYYASQKFVTEFSEALRRNRIPFNPSTLHLLQLQFENLETGTKGLTEDFNETSLHDIVELTESIQKIPELSVYHQSLTGWIGHFRDLYYNRLFQKVKHGEFQLKDSNVRDSLMALNMMYLRDRYAGKKIIGWGANAHFANNYDRLDVASSKAADFVSMGSHLKKALGKKVFILAVTTDDGYPETMEYELAARDVSVAWMSPADITNHVFASHLLERPASGNWSDVVDGILFFNSTENPKSPNGHYFINGKLVNSGQGESVAFASITLEGTTRGTASDIDGQYLFKIDSAELNNRMKISSIGYKTKYVTVKALLKNSTVYLEPETELLDEVVVTAKGADAKEILQEVIKRIPDNYLQTPFNLEFYSINTSIDTTSNKSFTLESVFMSYYEGYTLGANKAYRILHKRETDEYFMREKTHGMSQWPIWEVAYNDLYSNQVEKAVMTTEALSKIKPRFVGTQLFDGDTVFIIQYTYRVSGTLYVSSKDYAILKHVTLASGKGHVNRVELIYRKQNGKYFPYLANGDYRHEYKVDGTKKMLKITNRAVLNKIDVDNVKTIGHDQQVWIPKDVFYDKEYWDNNYPVER